MQYLLDIWFLISFSQLNFNIKLQSLLHGVQLRYYTNRINTMEEQKSQDPHSFDQRFLSPEGKYTIPEGVTEIAFRGFRGQEGIKSIEIPGSVKRIGNEAFGYCKNLKHVTLNEGLEVIGGFAFQHSGLESINIPRSVGIIGTWAFSGCENLKHVTLNEGLEVIGSAVFYNSALESINIPGSVKRIGESAFDLCKNLKNIIVEEGYVDIIKNLLPEEHKNKVILRKHYEIAQKIIHNVYQSIVMESTPLATELADMVGSYLNDYKAYPRMQAVLIPRTDGENAWNEYKTELKKAATNSAGLSSAFPSSSLARAASSIALPSSSAGDSSSSSSSAGGGGEGCDEDPGKGGCNIS